jgi:WD40 repeat protein
MMGHTDQVLSVELSPDGARVLTGSRDGTAKVWETAGGQELLTLKGHTRAVSSGAFSHDGRRIVTASWDGSARVWEAQSD